MPEAKEKKVWDKAIQSVIIGSRLIKKLVFYSVELLHKILTLEIFPFQLLAAGLMLKLVILTQEAVTEGALEDPPPMVPHTPVALQAVGVGQRACAGMGGQAATAVTHPSFTKVTYGTLHRKKKTTEGTMGVSKQVGSVFQDVVIHLLVKE